MLRQHGRRGQEIAKGSQLSFDEWMSGFLAPQHSSGENESEYAAEIASEVRRALVSLEEPERLALEGYHFMGRAPSEIAKDLSLSLRSFERTLRSAQSKMKNLLADFVAERFGLEAPSKSVCPICQCKYREQAEEIIASKKEEDTWRAVIRRLKTEMGMTIDTPQSLIGHYRYHQSLKPENQIK